MSAAPPYWQIDVQKSYDNYTFTNVYHVAASSQAAAAVMADGIVALERQLHGVGVLFLLYRVRAFPGRHEGTVYPLSGHGNQPAGTWLSPFNVMRVDFLAPTGRPSRKYYRLPVNDGIAGDGVFSDAWLTLVRGYFNSYFADPVSSGLIDVDGQILTSAKPVSLVAMRQLRRGSKRKARPPISA